MLRRTKRSKNEAVVSKGEECKKRYVQQLLLKR
jgi:hypothetical protein